jgi:cysteine desulfurase
MSAIAYLDHNATTPLRPGAASAMRAALELAGNPSSVHRFGRVARNLVEQARDQVGELAGVSAARVTFTSGATEANALALHGAGRRALVSGIEHDSVLANAPNAERIAVDARGVVDLSDLERRLAENGQPALVAVMLANNETGVIQPLADVARIAHRHGAIVLCDAVQAAGRIAFNALDLGADLLTLSAHKLGGPQGVGALVNVSDVALQPLVCGGGQERGLRPGTENVAGIVGFGAAAQEARAGLSQAPALAAERDRLEGRIKAIARQAMVVGADAPRLPNTSCLVMPAVPAETQVMALDLDGVAISAGAACSSGRVRASHVLAAMGLGPDSARSAIRVSLGWNTAAADIDRFVDSWTRLWTRVGEPRAIGSAA